MNTTIPHRILLSLFTAVFAIRTATQFVLQFHESTLLPEFDLWNSGTMSYPSLLLAQLLLLAIMVIGCCFARPSLPRPGLGNFILVIGWVYMFTMVTRMIIGAFDLHPSTWFDGSVSTAFHFVLAAYVLVFGSAIRGAWLNGNTPSNSILIRYAAYPSLLAGGYLLYTWLVATASPILFSAYLTVLVAGIGIFLHETFAPNREDWRPDTDDLIHDGVFLTLVQIALPALLKGLALVLIVTLAHNGGAPFDGFWPHTTPTILQVALMLFVAEFFRYWLHRTLSPQ